MDLTPDLFLFPKKQKLIKRLAHDMNLTRMKSYKNSEYQTAFRRVADSADFHNFANQVMEITASSINTGTNQIRYLRIENCLKVRAVSTKIRARVWNN